MSVHFLKEIDNIKKMLLNVAILVEESLGSAINSLRTFDIELATGVMRSDDRIDAMEIEVEEECLKTLALHQPVANDLRFVVGVLKINNDLERIGDLASNIAERVLYLAKNQPVNVPGMIYDMTSQVQSMLKKALDSLVNLDAVLAKTVCREDEQVDSLHGQMYGFIKDQILKEPQRTEVYLHLLSVSRYLERIADHTTNITEDVIYLVEGEISRHRYS